MKNTSILDYDATMEVLSSIYEDDSKKKDFNKIENLKPLLRDGKAIPGLLYVTPLSSGRASVCTFD